MVFDKTKNKSTGDEGEDLAAEYLAGKKYKILERNLRLVVGEIDVLTEDRGTYWKKAGVVTPALKSA